MGFSDIFGEPVGIIKFVEGIVGIVITGIIGYYPQCTDAGLAFMLSVVAYMIGIVLIILGLLIEGEPKGSKWYDLMFNGSAAILHIATGICFLMEVCDINKYVQTDGYEAHIAAAALAMAVGILYIASAVLSYKG